MLIFCLSSGLHKRSDIRRGAQIAEVPALEFKYFEHIKLNKEFVKNGMKRM
jgi:hypothetical protein